MSEGIRPGFFDMTKAEFRSAVDRLDFQSGPMVTLSVTPAPPEVGRPPGLARIRVGVLIGGEAQAVVCLRPGPASNFAGDRLRAAEHLTRNFLKALADLAADAD